MQLQEVGWVVVKVGAEEMAEEWLVAETEEQEQDVGWVTVKREVEVRAGWLVVKA